VTHPCDQDGHEPDNPEADVDADQIDAAVDDYERDLHRPWGG
jgi:hypothetical protein